MLTSLRFSGILFILASLTHASSLASEVDISLITQTSELEEKYKQNTAKIDSMSIPMSIQEAVQTGLMNNPLLEKSYREIQAQEWDKVSVMRGWIPTLNVNGYPAYSQQVATNQTRYIHPSPKPELSVSSSSSMQAGNSQNDGSGNQNIQSSSSSTVSASAGRENPQTFYSNQMAITPQSTFQWTFFDLQRGSNIAASQSKINSQKLLFDSSARVLILNIATQYYNLQATLDLLGKFQNVLDMSKRALIAINAQRRAGIKDIGDVAQMSTQYFQSLNRLISTQDNLIDYSSKLAKSLGFSSDALIIPNTPLKQLPPWTLTLDESIDLGSKNNELIYAAFENSKSNEFTALGYKQSYIPSLFLYAIGYMSRNNGLNNALVNRQGASNSNMINTSFNAQYGIGFTWSFDGGVNFALANSYIKRSEASLADSQSKKDQVVQNIKSSFGTYKTKELAVQSSSRGLFAAELSQKVAASKYEFGLSDITTLVQSLQLYTSAAEANVNAIRDYNQSIASLYRWSAIWPENTEQILSKREELLK